MRIEKFTFLAILLAAFATPAAATEINSGFGDVLFAEQGHPALAGDEEAGPDAEAVAGIEPAAGDEQTDMPETVTEDAAAGDTPDPAAGERPGPSGHSH